MTLRTKVLLGFAAPLAAVIVSSVVVYRSLALSAATAEWVSHTHKVIATANILLRHGVDAAINERRFLRTHDRLFGEASTKSITEFTRTGAELRKLVADDPTQLQRADRMEATFARWRAELAEREVPAEPGARGGSASSNLGGDAGGPAAAELNELKRRVEEFIQTERELLSQRTLANERTIYRGKIVSVLLPGLAMLMVQGIGLARALAIARSVSSIALATRALAAGDLSRRANTHGEDEIGLMAKAFNTMADQLERRARETAMLKDMGDLLQACLTVEEAVSVVAPVASRLLPAKAGAIFLMHTSRDHLEPMVVWGDPAAAGPVALRSEECWALRRGRIHKVNAAGAGQCCHLGSASSPAGCLCIPLLAHGETLGVLYIAWDAPDRTGSPGPSEEEREQLASSVAEQIALAFGNLRLREKLRSQSIRDPLTGLFNRRFLEETLERELRRAQRTGAPLGVIMFDIDHFKHLNDSFGHEAGDAVLREMAPLLSASLRKTDVACRYGGEEFLLILPDASLEATEKRAEYIREAARRLQVVHRGVPVGPVTLSLGVAAFPRHGNTNDTLLPAVDVALYRAKTAGRDQVVVADDPDQMPAVDLTNRRLEEMPAAACR
jgi:diguanylate cyclase (GGDEF)-like protein